MVAARFGNVRLVAAGCARPRVKSFAGIGRIEVSADVLEPGPLWNRVGRGRRGDGVLRLRAAVCVVEETVPRSAHRLASVGTGKTHVDDQRDHQGAVTRAASRPPQRCRKSAAPAYLDGQEK